MSFYTLLVCLAVLLVSPSYGQDLASNDSSNASNPGFLSRLFPQLNVLFERVNMQQMANLAMNPVIDNHTLVQLYQQANEIINSNGAEGVLLQLDQVDRPANQTATGQQSQSANNASMLVMAVANPNVPSHEDLLRRFRLYFVNVTEHTYRQPASNSSAALPNTPNLNRPSLWQILVNLVRNQANAVIGAFMLPFNVGAHAILKSSQQHAEYVLFGSALGSNLSAPIILQAIALPNLISQRVIEMTSYQANSVQSAEQRGKQMADSAITGIASGLSTGLTNGTDLVSQVTHRFIARPIASFTGFNLNAAGNTLASLGQGVSSTGLGLNLIGQQIGSGAVKAVSAGATAVAWGMDDTVNLAAVAAAERKNGRTAVAGAH